MIETPLFEKNQRTAPGVIVRTLDTTPRVLVRAYPSVNVATTTAAKYNARYAGHALTFYVRGVHGGDYGVFAEKEL